MNYAEDTKILESLSGSTDSTNASQYLRDMNLNKSTAHKVLDQVKLGIYHPMVTINQALLMTGDL